MQIVIFGASTDVGRCAARLLLDAGCAVRLVARDPTTLDVRAEHVVGTVADAFAFVRSGDIVINCAHARHTQVLLQGLPTDIRHLVLVGSTWLYSKVPNPNAEEVREAERLFIASGRAGVMLHPTMIYGGAQENNIQRLIAAIHRWPVFPVPGSGRHLVQPIFVDDVARSIAAAAIAEWDGPQILPIAGPRPFSWKRMVEICMDVAGRHRPFLHIPLRPAVLALTAVERLGVRLPVDSSMLLRVQEDKNFDIGPTVNRLKVVPREFEIGLRDALARAAPAHTRASSALQAPVGIE